MSHKGPTGIKKWKVYFMLKEGRWIISEWQPYVLRAAPPKGAQIDVPGKP
jgi:hypothetical protein